MTNLAYTIHLIKKNMASKETQAFQTYHVSMVDCPVLSSPAPLHLVHSSHLISEIRYFATFD